MKYQMESEARTVSIVIPHWGKKNAGGHLNYYFYNYYDPFSLL